ncbi:hypothetical protein PVA45_01345 [Entomospira entomophila]|uniref:Uncharacterized protein n=1 Tax=Entomospira entomophila TaxID=2719988 RepID=A0A968GC08_9SPIO|nr:hypothetical protein [Entomospira entomophilus]NIZ40164.1 hypothetical protein [Entomospira entomophilus]WDI35722.1 hypothetical protein PVA45_01345 [Entomospira entomophilus]
MLIHRFLFWSLFCIALPLQLYAEDQWQENDFQQSTPAQEEKSLPRIILMHPTVLFFEEGSGFSVDLDEAKQILEQAYLYVETYLAGDSSLPNYEQQNRQLTLSMIQQYRETSIAQIFGRSYRESRYIYINVFPRHSVTNQSKLQKELWRPHQKLSPAFWRIRYNLHTKEFYGLSYDFFN